MKTGLYTYLLNTTRANYQGDIGNHIINKQHVRSKYL